MKAYGYKLAPQAIKYSSAIRNKTDIIKLLVEISRLINIESPQVLSKISLDYTPGSIHVIIYIDKMSRVLIKEQNKIHSFNFPFSLRENSNQFILSCNSFDIDSGVCSILSTVFNDISDTTSLESILEKLWDTMDDTGDSKDETRSVTQLITFLLSFEPGYIRFDHDEKNAKGDLHPINHLDINYHSNTSYKLGLTSMVDIYDLIDIIDIYTDCMYISK